MKSLIFEAKNIQEAIKGAWLAAGQPERFLIKVLETGHSSWMWWNCQSAKIALSYDLAPEINSGYKEKRYQEREPRKKTAQEHTQSVPDKTKETERREKFDRTETKNVVPEAREQKNERPQRKYNNTIQENVSQKNEAPQVPVSTECGWDNEMISFAREWVHKTLEAFELKHSGITCIAEKSVLKIILSGSILNNDVRDKHLASSLSVLLLETMRKNSKKNMRGCQILVIYGQ